MRMLLWVTSKCNLSCPLCVVKHNQEILPDYEMSLGELYYFINESLSRGIYYDLIELTGGEPTQWFSFKTGIEMIYNGGICNGISLVSNGTSPEKIFEVEDMLEYYHISITQTPKDQLKKFERREKAIYTSSKHKILPVEPVEGTLPADCCSSNQVEYINGKVYYCCNALLQSKVHGLTDDLVCSFEDDFMAKFSNKKYDKQICTTYLCNEKVWNKID